MTSDYEILGSTSGSGSGFLEALSAWAPLLGAAVGFLGWSAHRILGALGARAIARSAVDLAQGRRSFDEVVNFLGGHAVATAASLGLPRYPVLGYLGGAFSSRVILGPKGDPLFGGTPDTEGGG